MDLIFYAPQLSSLSRVSGPVPLSTQRPRQSRHCFWLLISLTLKLFSEPLRLWSSSVLWMTELRARVRMV